MAFLLQIIFAALYKLQLAYWSQSRKVSQLTKGLSQRATKNMSYSPSPSRARTRVRPEGTERFSSTCGLTRGIRKSMLSRIIVSMAMAAVLLMAPVDLAARSCILSSAPSQKACQSSCCANKTCCATSPKNTALPSQPLAKADSSQQLNAACFAVALPFSNYETGAQQFRFQTTAPSANSPPRLALLCTFLI